MKVFTPANPNGTASAARVMMGTGITYKMTKSTQLLVIASFDSHGSGANINPQGSLNWGTGAAPSNGNAEAGTEIDQWRKHFETSGTIGLAFDHIFQGSIISGLAIGTTCWIDPTLAVDALSASISNITITVLEC
jgi:hypothetical protein